MICNCNTFTKEIQWHFGHRTLTSAGGGGISLEIICHPTGQTSREAHKSRNVLSKAPTCNLIRKAICMYVKKNILDDFNLWITNIHILIMMSVTKSWCVFCVIICFSLSFCKTKKIYNCLMIQNVRNKSSFLLLDPWFVVCVPEHCLPVWFLFVLYNFLYM